MFFKIKTICFGVIMNLQWLWNLTTIWPKKRQRATCLLTKTPFCLKSSSHQDEPSKMLIRTCLLDMALNYTPSHPQQSAAAEEQEAKHNPVK